MNDFETKVRAAAAARGATVEIRQSIVGPGFHMQIRGQLLVNYYPLSKKKSAYVAGTVGKRNNVTPDQAVAMAFEPPPIVAWDKRDDRSSNSRRKRAKIAQRNGWKCHWCPVVLTLDTSTLDHRIPLMRGGLDNANNRVLACEPCNHDRGHDMPELKKEAAKC